MRRPIWLAGLLLAGVTGWMASVQPAAAARPTSGIPTVWFRPVICAVPAYNPTLTPPISNKISASSCAPNSLLNVSNLDVQPSADSANGFTSSTPPSEADLGGEPSTTPANDESSKYVLLPTLGNVSYLAPRYVLGPSQMSSASISHATAYKDRVGQWVVDYSTTTAGSRVWDRVANRNFHLMLAIDLNGVVVSAPIIQPLQTSFSSLNGKGEIAGNLTRAVARELALAMNSKPRDHP